MTGARLRVENEQGSGDDSGTNGIEISTRLEFNDETDETDETDGSWYELSSSEEFWLGAILLPICIAIITCFCCAKR